MLGAIDAFLAERLGADLFPPEERFLRGGASEVRRLGLALEASPALAGWIREERLDALFLHRFRARPGEVPADLPLVGFHLPFDERLTVGWNPDLADALGLLAPEPLGARAGRPLGMLGSLEPQPFERFRAGVEKLFDGQDEAVRPAGETVDRVAVVGAMNDALVREAADRGAQLYVTGQARPSARAALADTGLGLVAVGHRRSELFGLSLLARTLWEQWSELVVVRL